MKTLLWPAIFLSLGLNVVLAWRMGASRSPAAGNFSATGSAAVNPERTKANPANSALLWAGLQTETPAGLVARLRDAGFPPEVVRAIVRAQIQEEFSARLKALDPDAASRPFWKRGIPDPKVMVAQRQLYREQEDRVRALLGRDADATDPMTLFYQTSQFGDLSPEKMEQVQAIQRDFSDKQSDLFSALGGVVVSSQMDRMRKLEKQQRDALTRILSPKELEDYDFRTSSAASSVRMRTSGMDLTEYEFRSLYQLQQDFEEKYGMRAAAPPSQEEVRQRMDAQRQQEEQVKAVLGPVRYEEYERAIQPDYRSTNLLVARLELPPGTTQQIWKVREDFMQRATAVRTTRGLSPDQRNQQLAAIQQEAATAITPLVGGPRGFEAYQQYGGSWLQRLVPPPPPPRPGPP